MILVNGCSFTEGYDLEDINNNWPSQMSRLLDHPVTNLALGGASNDRIYRTTKEWLINNQKPKHVIIGWTSHTRNELHHELGMYMRALGSHVEQENGPDPGDLDAIHKFWINHMFNEWVNYRNWIYNVLFLQNYFESNNVGYTFFSAFTQTLILDFINSNLPALELSDQGRHNRKTVSIDPSNTSIEFIELQKLCKQINLHNWVLPESNLMSYVYDLGFENDPSGHFYADGYAAWANYISQYLLDNKLV